MPRHLAHTALVLVGATGPMGAAIAAELRARGADLTLVDRDRRMLDQSAIPGPSVAGDIADDHVCEAAIDSCLTHFGRVDGLVHAPHVEATNALLPFGDNELEQLVGGNLLGPLRLARAALSHLESGFVATLPADVSEQSPAAKATYADAQTALATADASLREQLRRANVDVIGLPPLRADGRGQEADPDADSTATDSETRLSTEARRIVDALVTGEPTAAASVVSSG